MGLLVSQYQEQEVSSDCTEPSMLLMSLRITEVPVPLPSRTS